jgi:hypothetical protein
MTVHPVSFNADGSIDVVYDEMGHSGTIPPEQIVWTIFLGGPSDGAENHNYIRLECPDGCGATSTWPVGGGADATMGQQMFVEKTARDGCACGQTAPGDTSATPTSHVRLLVNRMDGIGRWQLDTPAQVSARENAPDMFQVVYRKADNLIVGLEPSGGVGPDNSVGVIHDMAEYEVLMRTDPAWLSSDGNHIQGSPPA